ncbi:MAG: ABC transporter substrate-binding protein [Burkholderiaceae bacterium]
MLALPMAAPAQPAAKVHRIGMLSLVSSSTFRNLPNVNAFFDGLNHLGYVEGKNLVVEVRFSDGKLERLADLAVELVALKPDVIWVPVCGAPLDAAKRATRTIPIVVATCTSDMVAAGVVASLARPGGNVTGQQGLAPELSAKRLELLKQMIPAAARVAVLWDPGYSDFAADWLALRSAAQVLSVTLLPIEARGPAEFDAAFAAMARQGAQALIPLQDANTYLHAQRLVDLAAHSRIPAIYPYRENSNAGGLMSYGIDVVALWRHSATFIDRILKGAKAGDLPVEQPTRFEMIINLKTAKALGVTIPQALRLRADQVIE